MGLTKELNYLNKGLKLDSATDAKEIIDILENNDDIEVIKLSGNSLGVKSAHAISKSLSKQKNLKKLYWSDIFTGRLKSEIPLALQSLFNGIIQSGSKIIELDLSDNAFGPAGIIAIKLLFDNEASDNLQVLKFNNNGMGIEGGKVLASYLKTCQKRCHLMGKKFSLREFYAGRNRLENKGAKALSESFKSLHSLEIVSIPQNGIYHEGITALSQAFVSNSNMKVINLNDNTATHLGAFSLSKALISLPELESVNIGDCLLKDKGACYIAKAFRQSGAENLKELIMNNNEITLKGAFEILENMVETSVKQINLNGNCFGQAGIEQLVSFLESAEKLNVLGSLSEDEGTADENSDQSSYENLSQPSSSDDEYDEENEGEEDDLVVVDKDVIGLGKSFSDTLALDKGDVKIGAASPFQFTPSSNIFQSFPTFQFTMPDKSLPPSTLLTNSIDDDKVSKIFGNTSTSLNFAPSKPFGFGPDSNFTFSLAPVVNNSASLPTNTVTPFKFNQGNDTANFKTFDFSNQQPPPSSTFPSFVTYNLPTELTPSQLDYCRSLINMYMVNSDMTMLKSSLKNHKIPDIYSLFYNFIKNKSPDIDKIGMLLVKIITDKNMNSNESTECTNDLMKAIFQNSAKYNENQLISSLLSHSGFLKSEDKKFVKPNPEDMEKVNKALKIISEKPYITSSAHDMLKAFIK